MISFFFFQAEDGIRDGRVTGVQTCALPISAPLLGLMGTVIGMIEIFGSQAPTGGNNPALLAHGISVALYNTAFGRSEERRVGKEWRFGTSRIIQIIIIIIIKIIMIIVNNTL